MSFTPLVTLASEFVHEGESGLPAWAVGLITLALLLSLMVALLVFGKGREHS